MDPSLYVLIEGVETEVEEIEGILKRKDVRKISLGHHRKRRFVILEIRMATWNAFRGLLVSIPRKRSRRWMALSRRWKDWR